MQQNEYGKKIIAYLQSDGYQLLEKYDDLREFRDTGTVFRMEKHGVDFLIMTYETERIRKEISDSCTEELVRNLQVKEADAASAQLIFITNGCVSNEERDRLRKRNIYVMDASRQKFPWNK